MMKADKTIPAMLDLATGKATTFMTEYDSMFRQLPLVIAEYLVSTRCSELSKSVQGKLRHLSLRICTGQCAAFCRRIVNPMSK